MTDPFHNCTCAYCILWCMIMRPRPKKGATIRRKGQKDNSAVCHLFCFVLFCFALFVCGCVDSCYSLTLFLPLSHGYLSPEKKQGKPHTDTDDGVLYRDNIDKSDMICNTYLFPFLPRPIFPLPPYHDTSTSPLPLQRLFCEWMCVCLTD